eukprot:TRINITY_DN38044_c0_g1_i1.p1 TRINITY_DN38044_c0_g1~~TRINITY_DN38044_c0_g1_i1.p1  ORF type:complete len:103 (-),score=20.38 TRINITY_DN38044_c0_g1_i1:65-373(-)
MIITNLYTKISQIKHKVPQELFFRSSPKSLMYLMALSMISSWDMFLWSSCMSGNTFLKFSMSSRSNLMSRTSFVSTLSPFSILELLSDTDTDVVPHRWADSW